MALDLWEKGLLPDGVDTAQKQQLDLEENMHQEEAKDCASGENVSLGGEAGRGGVGSQ